MKEYFNDIADRIQPLLRGREVYTCAFQGEDSDFVRFNQGEIRQAGSVVQRSLALDLIEGLRHATGTVALSGNLETDRARLTELVEELRAMRQQLLEDPHLLYATDPRSGELSMPDRLPEGTAAIEDIRAASRGRDLVGIYASGGIHAGFANSLGQRNWYTNFSFNLDWSFYHAKDKAVKTGYAGFEWNDHEFRRKVEDATEQLKVLSQPARTITPGRYRVYLAPRALSDLMGQMQWGGFGLKARMTKQSQFMRMIEGDARLHRGLTVTENTVEGVAPNFQEAGFLRPPRVTLIEDGVYRDCLVSPRSSREYGVPTNGATSEENPQSMDVAAGDIPAGEVLRRLDTGILINNLWYLNWSDRPACRTTGLTRFATFWVEHGQIRAPLNVMRFDETAYRMLGENLEGLTVDREMILDPSSYYGRSTLSGRMPGALIDAFTLTL